MSLWGCTLGPLLTRATLPSTWYPSARRPAVFSLKKMNFRSSSEAGERHIRSDAEEDVQMLDFEKIFSFWFWSAGAAASCPGPPLTTQNPAHHTNRGRPGQGLKGGLEDPGTRRAPEFSQLHFAWISNKIHTAPRKACSPARGSPLTTPPHFSHMPRKNPSPSCPMAPAPRPTRQCHWASRALGDHRLQQAVECQPRECQQG